MIRPSPVGVTNLSKLESVLSLLERILPHHPDSEKFRELVVETTVLSVSRYVRSPGDLGLTVIDELPEMIG